MRAERTGQRENRRGRTGEQIDAENREREREMLVSQSFYTQHIPVVPGSGRSCRKQLLGPQGQASGMPVYISKSTMGRKNEEL